MDDIQISLKKSANEIVNVLDDRQRLKSILADCLPNNKLYINLLLNAYDNDVVKTLQNNNDASDQNILLQRLVQSLTGDYGITENAALWVIDTWCCILGITTINANISVQNNTGQNANNHQQIDINTILADYESHLLSSHKESTVKNYMQEIKSYIKQYSIENNNDITNENLNDYVDNSPLHLIKKRNSIITKFREYLNDSQLLQVVQSTQANSSSNINVSSSISTFQQSSLISLGSGQQNIPQQQALSIPGVSQDVLDKLLEDDDYIDMSHSEPNKYYVIRSPSIEQKAGIILNDINISYDSPDHEYNLVSYIHRSLARKKKRLYFYLYSNKGIFVYKSWEDPDFDHYHCHWYGFNFPKEKISFPFFIRLIFKND